MGGPAWTVLEWILWGFCILLQWIQGFNGPVYQDPLGQGHRTCHQEAPVKSGP